MVSSPEATHESFGDDNGISEAAHENICSTSDDEFISSGDEGQNGSSDKQRNRIAYNSSLTEHAEYFTKTLAQALDSAQMDRSLVVQAQLSGHINNKNQNLIEKKEELLQKLGLLKQLHEKHVASDRLGQLEKDIKDLSIRLNLLKNGVQKTLLLGRKHSEGVAQKFPVEYNQARDRILEREYEDL